MRLTSLTLVAVPLLLLACAGRAPVPASHAVSADAAAAVAKIRHPLQRSLARYDEQTPDCRAAAGALPDPAAAPGTVDLANPIQHIVVIMQENHSFDSQLGALTMSPAGTGFTPSYSLPQPDREPGPTTLDGLDEEHLGLNVNGRCRVHQKHFPAACPAIDPNHGWDALHRAWNQGANDKFLAVNRNPAVMGYFQRDELPYYYWLADEFAIADRYFCSLLGPTWPNRSFLYAGTAFGILETYQAIPSRHTPTVFDLLTDSPDNPIPARIRASLADAGIVYPASEPLWKYYSDAGGPHGLCKSDGDYPQQLYPGKHYPCAGDSDRFAQDVFTGRLAPVTFIDADLWGEDERPGTSEHPAESVGNGQNFVAKVVNALMASGGPAGYWGKTAIFLTYDENGGFYDHVPPPKACLPDNIAPVTGQHSTNQPPYAFDNLGFRVPLTVISPFAKRHYVSHAVYDHTSILRFIEYKFNLPALTRRDANADPLLDLFDFTQAPRAVPVGAPPTRVMPCPHPVPNLPGCE